MDPRSLIELADTLRAKGHTECADLLEARVNEAGRLGIWILLEDLDKNAAHKHPHRHEQPSDLND